MADQERLIIVSKVKEYIHGKGCQTSGEALEALNKAVQEVLNKAVDRTRANGRATVKATDL
jgi:histone H3/H4